jgi:hypothetical protein
MPGGAMAGSRGMPGGEMRAAAAGGAEPWNMDLAHPCGCE